MFKVLLWLHCNYVVNILRLIVWLKINRSGRHCNSNTADSNLSSDSGFVCVHVLQDLSSGQRKSGKFSRRESSCCSEGNTLGRCSSSHSAQDSSSSSAVASRKDNEWKSMQFSEALVHLKPQWRFSPCICCNSGGYKSFGSYPKISHFYYLFLRKNLVWVGFKCLSINFSFRGKTWNFSWTTSKLTSGFI